MGKGRGVSACTHTRSQCNHYANQHNPNNSAYRANQNNHAKQWLRLKFRKEDLPTKVALQSRTTILQAVPLKRILSALYKPSDKVLIRVVPKTVYN